MRLRTIASLLAALWLGLATAQSLDMWSWRTEDIDAYNRILEAYEGATGADVTFEAFLNTEYNTLVATSLQANEAADVVQTRSYGGVMPWIDGGYLVALDGQPALDNYLPEALGAVSSRETGEVFGVPFAVQVLTVFYNKDIFDELGLSEPTTWDEFMAINETILDAGIIPISLTGKDSWMLPIFHSVVGAGTYGGQDFVEGILDGTRTFEDPAFVESLRTVKMLQPYLPPDVTGVGYADSQALFINGLAAMFPGGSWEGAYFRGQNPDLNIGAFSVPARITNEAMASWFVDGAWAVSTSADDQEAALDFVNWLGSPEFGQAFTDELAQISPIAGVTPSDPLLSDIVDLWNANPTDYMLLVHFRYGTPSGTTVIGEDIQKLFLDDMTAEQAAASLQEQMASWFTPSGQ